jgi:hypothetical protein
MIPVYVKTTDAAKTISCMYDHLQFKVRMLASDYTTVTAVCIWEVISDTRNAAELIAYSSQFGEVIDKVDAYVTGKVLQPDRQLVSSAGDVLDFTFDTILPMTLAEAKSIKIALLDVKTDSIFRRGIVHNATTFSLSIEAQKNYWWMQGKIKSGEWTDLPVTPFKYKTQDETCYTFATLQELLDFTNAAETQVFSIIHSAYPFVDAINACTTIQQVNDIVDTRP